VNVRRSLIALACLALSPAAVAADLSKIDRTIAKEPAYQTKEVAYCLLVFGADAKTRVWLVQDGETLYVDRNGNGDLTEDGERVALKRKDKTFRVFEAGSITDGPLTHTLLSLVQRLAGDDEVGDAKELTQIKGHGTEPWVWSVGLTAERAADDDRKLPRKIGYVANGDVLGYLVFADRPQDAPVIHLNGPWSLGLQDIKQRLTVGRQSQLRIGVGTPGIGPGTFAFVLYPDTIPADAYPVAEITFPPKSPADKPPTGSYTLTDRC
jgi:hypothetical protein